MNSVCVGENLVFVFEKRSEGPAVHLMIRMPPNPPHNETRQFRQVWRADLFGKGRAHQHFFASTGEQQDFPPDAAQDPIEWCLLRLREVNKILHEAGYLDLSIDQEEVDRHFIKLADKLDAVK